MPEVRSAIAPITRRPLDLALACFFSISVVYGFLFSLPEGLGVPVAPDSPWPPLRALHDWAVAEEPAHLDPPPSLIAACLFDGFAHMGEIPVENEHNVVGKFLLRKLRERPQIREQD